jgi:hypothetical protein
MPEASPKLLNKGRGKEKKNVDGVWAVQCSIQVVSEGL